jgi:hypothetical protein
MFHEHEKQRLTGLDADTAHQRVNQPDHSALVLRRQRFHLLKSLPKPLPLRAAVAVALRRTHAEQFIRRNVENPGE